MEQFIADLASKFPVVLSILAAIGTFRIVFKPLMTGIDAVVGATPTKADDAILEKAKASGIYKAICWFVDLTASIKLPGWR